MGEGLSLRIWHWLWMEDLIWRNSRKWFSPMLYLWPKWGKETRVLLWNKCLRCVMPLLIHVGKWSVFLLITKSGLFQMGVCLLGDIVVLVIWWRFHQADRAVAIAEFLKQGWCVWNMDLFALYLFYVYPGAVWLIGVDPFVNVLELVGSEIVGEVGCFQASLRFTFL